MDGGLVPYRGHAESQPTGRSATQLLLVVRSLWGAVLLTRPRRVGNVLGLELADAAPGRGVIQLLGGRHLGQAVVTAARPTGTVVALGAAVDGLHALTALGWGVLDRSHRRAGLTDAALAASFGVAGALAARNTLAADRQAQPHGRTRP
jgi:hypothetical protein